MFNNADASDTTTNSDVRMYGLLEAAGMIAAASAVVLFALGCCKPGWFSRPAGGE